VTSAIRSRLDRTAETFPESVVIRKEDPTSLSHSLASEAISGVLDGVASAVGAAAPLPVLDVDPPPLHPATPALAATANPPATKLRREL